MEDTNKDPPMRIGKKFKDGHWEYLTVDSVGVTDIYLALKENDDIVKITIDKYYRRK